MIRVDVRRKAFGQAEVLRNIRFEIAPGEAVALLGPSGVGKSTLLRIIAGIDGAFDGDVETPRRMAMVFQEPTLLPWRSALRNLILVHPDLSVADAERSLASVGLAGKADLYPGQLSLGQQRRLALARAFAGAPDFLIMDEPFVSLDEATAEEMLRLTERLLAEHRPSLLFVTHAQAEAERLASRILRLAGSPASLV